MVYTKPGGNSYRVAVPERGFIVRSTVTFQGLGMSWPNSPDSQVEIVFYSNPQSVTRQILGPEPLSEERSSLGIRFPYRERENLSRVLKSAALNHQIFKILVSMVLDRRSRIFLSELET